MIVQIRDENQFIRIRLFQKLDLASLNRVRTPITAAPNQDCTRNCSCSLHRSFTLSTGGGTKGRCAANQLQCHSKAEFAPEPLYVTIAKGLIPFDPISVNDFERNGGHRKLVLQL